ncbi:extracellular solute-binding protein [Shimia marina]|uniref:Putative ABC transporter-binding protein n=1 Tax=Shimia marina TaxID=321267 RepID=A0A0P1EPV1_9RHOB|nr:putative ABC transporter-binding protein precursor [Shimia marina]SFE10814.1 microcin C transport system substrate-binding protein [Shimia marina]
MAHSRVATIKEAPPKTLNKFLVAGAVMLGLLASASGLKAEGDGVIRSHGYSFYGDLKYPADFEHFDYVNPDAPKGGEIALWAPGTFDSMNPYSRKGRAGRYSWMMFESLLGEMPATGGAAPADTYGEAYGLLAESLEYDEGKTWVIFHMRKNAKFSDGTPVTAHDVLFSHNLLLEQGLPSYAQAVKKRIPRAEVIDDHTIKFYFTEGISRRSLIDQVGGVPVWSKKWYEETGARLDEPRMETSPGSGPYVIDSYDVNRRIVYKRNPEYWAKDLPINVGRHNFDSIRIEYFGDASAAFEAFKAGEYTFRAETNSKQWATGYDFPAVEKGDVKTVSLPDGTPPTPSGFVFNLGRETLQDRRVREAISMAYNFEWVNESLQFGLFKQRHSFVQGAPHEAMGLPEGAERALFESLGDLVPDAVLNAPAIMAHESSSAREIDRRNLRKAMGLLDEAGWIVGDDGLRRNQKGETLKIVIPYSSSDSATMGAILEVFVQNLGRMGIDAKADKIDPAQFTLKRRERSYDMIFGSYASFLGTGTGLLQRYGSEEAAISLFNPAGLASPLVDKIINISLEAQSSEEEATALMALDRVLRYERFMIPVWFNDASWVAYYDQYEYPQDLPPYAVGVLDFWWYNEEKAARLKAEGALR